MDKTYKQALIEMQQRRMTALFDEIQRCAPLIAEGATISSVTAQIPDQHLRNLVSHVLLSIRVSFLIEELVQVGMISTEHNEEIQAYLLRLFNFYGENSLIQFKIPRYENCD
jgi:hypothetical protein